MTTQFHHTWGDFGGIKHPNEIKYEAATIIANGGLLSIGDQMPPNGKLIDGVYESIKECNTFVREREEFCIEATPVKSIAVLAKEDFPYSSVDVNFFFTQNKLPNLQGATKILVKSHQQFDLVDEWMDIDKYKVLFIPELMELNDLIIEKIKNFVKDGGILIASHLSSLKANNFALADVLGVDFLNMSPYSFSYAKLNNKLKKGIPDINFVCYDTLTNVRPGKGTEVLGNIINPLIERNGARYFSHCQAPEGVLTDYPIATLHNYGKGKAVYISIPIFSLYFKEDYYIYRLFIQNILNMVYTDNVIKEVNGPLNLEINLMEQKRKKPDNFTYD